MSPAGNEMTTSGTGTERTITGAAPVRRRPWHAAEDFVGVLCLLAMVALPLVEIVGRPLLGIGVPGSVGLVQHLTMWVAFVGAMIASRQRRHLALATASFLPARVRPVADVVASAATATVGAVLAWTSAQMVYSERLSVQTLTGNLPIWAVQTIIPIGFGVVALRAWWQAGRPLVAEGQEAPPSLSPGQAWGRRVIVLAVALAAVGLAFTPESMAASVRWPLILALVAATVLGAPIFVTLGGAALVLFYADLVPLAAVASQTYGIVSSPTLPTIPLFTLAGVLLAEGGTPGRLVRLFQALAGWLPGGTAVAAILVCAFFTTFTGASGVTILALGGLLLPVLTRDVYSERFALGAVTSAGSIGLLFPPSLPVILYGISARTPVNEMFAAALVPGIVLVGLVSLYCLKEGLARGGRWRRPDPGEVGRAAWQAKWEILLPVIVFVSLFGGFATTVEAAAITAAYAFFVKCVVHRDVSVTRALPRVVTESTVLVGGVLIILGCALGLTGYLIDAEIPMQGAAWVKSAIHSRWLFLLTLNVFLLVVGSLMDIFSAIFVVVPLILPIAAAFDVHPLHLGAIFLTNLELGYLTPPVGLNLFLASLRFRRSMYEVTRAALPFLAVQATAVLLVTYLPALSVEGARWLMALLG
ncbi:MAG TPA: TRAP transporter large permease subunit [Vicinamibacterales bacterium]|nr:TRAP transporter large permease subunit [Vicinamibacterales bacterium]